MKPVTSGQEWLQKQADDAYVITPETVFAKSSALFVTVRDRINKNKATPK